MEDAELLALMYLITAIMSLLFSASELLALSRCKPNSVTQWIFQCSGGCCCSDELIIH